jgi:monoamine oxidase
LVLGCSETDSRPEVRGSEPRPGTYAAASATTAAAQPSAAPTSSVTAAPAPVTAMDPRAFVPAPVPDRARVVVVGGGFAGLIAAYKLRKAGIDVHVLESLPRVGGRVNTAYYPGGAQAEFGVQELWDDNPIYTIARELGVKFEEPSKGEPAFSSLYEVEDPAKKGEKKLVLFPYPESEPPRQFFDALLAKDGKPSPEAYEAFEKWLKTAADLRKRALEKGLADPEVARLQKLSFGAWVREAKLDPKLEEFVAMVLDCEIASTSETYSALFGLLEYGIVLEDLHYFHAVGGNHKIPEALAAAIGPHITTGARVVRIDLPAKDKPAAGEISVHYMIDGHIGVVQADRVVLAVPWVRLHEIDMRPALSKEKWDAIEGERDTGKSKRPQLPGLNRGKYVVVHILIDRKRGEELWRDKKTNRTPFPILSNGKLGVIYGVRGEGDPSSDTEVFSLLVYGEYANNLHMQPVHRVEAMAVEELERLWPGFGKIVKGFYVYSYHPAAVPVWPPGRSPIDDASKTLWKPEHGLYLAGDYLVNAHSDGAARSAICQSDRLLLDLAGKPAPTGLCYYVPNAAP